MREKSSGEKRGQNESRVCMIISCETRRWLSGHNIEMIPCSGHCLHIHISLDVSRQCDHIAVPATS